MQPITDRTKFSKKVNSYIIACVNCLLSESFCFGSEEQASLFFAHLNRRIASFRSHSASVRKNK